MNLQKKMKFGMKSTLATCALGAAFVLAAPAALATVYGYTTGGSACKAASGPGAAVFYFSNLSAQNTSASTKYLSCMYVDVNRDNVTSPERVLLNLINPTASPINFTCVLQAGNEGTDIINSQLIEVTVAPNSTAFPNQTGSNIPARVAYAGYTISCAVPSQGKVALLGIENQGTIAP